MYIDITTDRFDELNKNHLFFLRLYTNIHYDEQGREQDYSKWQSIDRDLGISFDAGNFADRSLGYCLCIVEKAEQKKDKDGKDIEGMLVMYFHDANGNKVDDWQVIFSDYASRAQNVEDKYAFLCLLWMLANKSWSTTIIEACLRRFDHQTFPFFIDALNKIGKCLSVQQQNAISILCNALGGHYQVYIPPIVTQLYKALLPNTMGMENRSLYVLIDSIFNATFRRDVVEPLKNTNPLAAVLEWFNNEKALQDYSVLRPVFAMLNEDHRLNIVKRYFHDVRLGNTTLDFSIIEQFKENDYDEFIRYRYCINTPSEPVILTIPLLCDNLLTIHKTNGKTFQSFDGVLDFAMTHCDHSHPAIQFKLERFLPVCDGGAVYNRGNFKGFIDYSTIRKLDESKFTEEILLKVIYDVLDRYGQRQYYYCCREDESMELKKWCDKCSYLKKVYYTDKWIISSKYVNILNGFLKEPLKTYNADIPVDGIMLSADAFKQYIISMTQKEFESVGNDEFVVRSYSRRSQSYELYLIEQFSKILRMRIFPQYGAIVGKKFDVFGFWETIQKSYESQGIQMTDENRKRATAEFEAQESTEVVKRTIESLRLELNLEMTESKYFELPFDRNTLAKIIHKYYYKGTINYEDPLYMKEFLSSSNTDFFRPFCAPELATKHNPAIDIPYFWCRGNECFHNSLGKQTLEKQRNWHDYTLYHFIEIMGFPKLHETEAGYEPDPVVWQFIAVTNKVAQKFKRLKCRSCGHMLFSSYRITGFNRFNYYGCINPACEENRKLVYLNFCYSCKKGLIDSRDSKQCPNGWYICPTCLSCCDDAQYERQAQRYILSGRPVPERIEEMRGHGHNDKGEYFCPQCGNPIEIIADENGTSYKGCRTCKRNFDKESEDKDMYGYH